uniref:Uncharacterized protein n=1 Tax=Panagrolaimus sp. ES5 TaxID=591445 RepID=A0AC34FIH5_9BILA
MIGLLDQNVSPNPWAHQQQRDQQQQQQQSSSSSGSGSGAQIPKLSPPMKALDAMDEEVEDEEIQLPLRDEENNDEFDYPQRYEPMDLDDEIIIDCDNDHIREIRERKRTISMKLKETVEAFRRMNGMGAYGGSSSSSGGEISTNSPHRNPKLSNKMSSTESGVECTAELLPPNTNASRRESLSVYGAEARRMELMRPRRQTITNKWPLRKALAGGGGGGGNRQNNETFQAPIFANGGIAVVPPGGVGPASDDFDEESKFSNDSQFVDDFEMDGDEDFNTVNSFRGRRFSVPEKVLREAFGFININDLLEKTNMFLCFVGHQCVDRSNP